MILYTVYILYSKKDKNLYVGCTLDVEKRVIHHNKGNVLSTRERRPLVLIHSEKHVKDDAFQRERFLKSLWGAREKNKIKQRYLNNVGLG